MNALFLTGIFVLLAGNMYGDWKIVWSRVPREPMGPPISYRR
jgi:hypothetical protein